MSSLRNPFSFIVTLAGVAVLTLLLTGLPARAAGTAVVRVDLLNLRAQPDMKARTMAVLPKETRVAVLESRADWLKVRYKGKTGYLRNSPRYVKVIAARTPPAKNRAQVDAARQKARKLDERIKSSQAAVVSYTKQEAEVVRGLDTVERSLDRARKRVAAARAELARTDSELAKNQQALAGLEKQIAIAETYAAERLVALYKLSWLGRINLLASADSMGEMLMRERALSSILEQDESHLANLERSYARLEVLQDKQRRRKAAKQALEVEYRRRAGEMSSEKGRKAAVLLDIRGKRSLELAAIEAFKEDARNLDKTIRQLGKAVVRVPTPKAPPAPGTAAAPRKLPESFTARKGLLKLPVKGKIKNSFGTYRNEKFKTKNFRSGIDISADRGEPVYAVFPGRVLYSSWFKGYGNMLIIDHGGHYYTVYAHVEEIFKQKGEVVEDHEVIATVGDTGSLEGPGLYFEVRYHGKPLDPVPWIRKG